MGIQQKVVLYTSNNKKNNEPQTYTSLTRTEISTELTVQQFILGIKIWKETTTTSPSARHLGHYKTIIRDKNLAQIFTTMTTLSLKYGFAPKRWTTAIQVVPPKDSGALKITRLRNINILEADYNLILRTIWGRCMILVKGAQQKGHKLS